MCGNRPIIWENRPIFRGNRPIIPENRPIIGKNRPIPNFWRAKRASLNSNALLHGLDF
ncbi:MAG: hypothetical protein ABS934_15095 [Psychrobacillus sp.]